MQAHRISRPLAITVGLGALLAIVTLSANIGSAPVASGAEATATADDYLGRWDLWLDETGDTFRSSWLSVEGEGGKLSGRLVWKWGSVEPIQNVVVEGGTLRFARGDERYAARREGAELVGTATMGDGQKTGFRGNRAPEMCEIAGTWKAWGSEDAERREATLRFEVREGKVSGTAEDPDGNEYRLRDLALEGYVLRGKIVRDRPGGGEYSADLRLEVRGDRLAGEVKMVPPGQTEERQIQLEGRRERKWGRPVTLLSESGLGGWQPRDPTKRFGWKVEGGVLSNSPPDDDIMSERKFRDFKLSLEYKVPPRSNSGVYIRGRYELQIVGDTRVQAHGNMAVYSRLSPKKNPMRPFEEWQSLEVTFIGRWVTVVLNGEVVHDNEYLEGITGGAIDPWEGEPGPLLLQGDHGLVSYRSIVVTPAE